MSLRACLMPACARTSARPSVCSHICMRIRDKPRPSSPRVPRSRVVLLRKYRFVTTVPFTTDPLRPQLDIESLLHSISRQVIQEQTHAELSSMALQARGLRCLQSWQATQVLRAKQVGNIMGSSREAQSLRRDVARLASPEMSAQHVPLLLDVIFRQLRR